MWGGQLWLFIAIIGLHHGVATAYDGVNIVAWALRPDGVCLCAARVQA
jgi:hypothetical protein